jgi:hypothetical protein
VAADASRARVLQVAGPKRLVEIDNLLNPDGRLEDREINTDARGRFSGGHTGEETSAQPSTGPSASRSASAKFLGMMRKSLGKEVEKLVADQVPKDLSWFNERELESYFAKGK